ncbi:hypothetical protein AWC30_11880 [Mycolicibacillus trivialis]|uniref:Uncharacterized protein n=2 Tax=Mycolicibacillus trivialis TaxID=1798 RepID=A0A1X2EIJ8_9MYCO|nr:hypothetical protein AWC30_11880 [Mycolicibacillus trivialis]
MVAATPVAAPTLQQITFPGIELTAQDLIGDTAGNLTNLINYFAGAPVELTNGNFLGPNAAPFPILQAVIGNQLGYLGQILQDPSNIGGVFQTMFGNLQDGLAAPFSAFGDNLATGSGLVTSPDVNWAIEGLINIAGSIADPNWEDIANLNHSTLFDLAQLLLGGDSTLSGLLGFTGSPMSGLMLGAIGPFLGPMVALYHGMEPVFDTGNTAGLIDIPQNMLYAFLNGGQTLDITDLLGVFNIPTTFDLLGMDIGLQSAGIELGGLLGGPGSLFNALAGQAGIDVPGFDLPIGGDFGGMFVGGKLVGEGAGPIGSLLSIPNSIAAAIGNDAPFDGLLGTFANSLDSLLNIDFLGEGVDTISAFLGNDILSPLSDALMWLPNELAGLLSDSGLGVDLGVDALAQMFFVNIPQLLLTMML